MDQNEKEQLALELLPNAAAQLRGALGNIKLAVSRLAPPEARDFNGALDENAAILYQSYYRMLRLVNNFSDAANLLEERPPVMADEDLALRLRELCDRVQPLATLKGLTLRFQCELEGHLVACNADALERLMLNLLSNAFKFTDGGGTVTVELKAAPGQVLLSVSDTGRGIPPDLLPTLFDRDTHTKRQDPLPHGLGLGLPLCRAIAKSHGGSLIAFSEEGKGTKVTLSLPDRTTGTDRLSDVRFDYAGGFNRTLLELSDALPHQAYLQKHMD